MKVNLTFAEAYNKRLSSKETTGRDKSKISKNLMRQSTVSFNLKYKKSVMSINKNSSRDKMSKLSFEIAHKPK